MNNACNILKDFVFQMNLGNLDKVMNLFSLDGIVVGYASSEYSQGHEQIKSSLKALSSDSENEVAFSKIPEICPENSPLWASGLYTINDETDHNHKYISTYNAWISINVINENNNYKISHMHISSAVYDLLDELSLTLENLHAEL